jgi:two-component system, OmpR family, phosphate regulon response regulator PhoB
MKARILVVDDEPDVSALVAYHLARESYRVQTVADGAEAMRAVESDVPDLIVLDLMLPGMSGMEVLREMRNRPEMREVPIILLTAKREQEDRIAGLSVGADDYIVKPFSPQELVLRVSAVLRRSRQIPPAGPTGRTLRVAPSCSTRARRGWSSTASRWTSRRRSSGCSRSSWSGGAACRAAGSCSAPSGA